MDRLWLQEIDPKNLTLKFLEDVPMCTKNSCRRQVSPDEAHPRLPGRALACGHCGLTSSNKPSPASLLSSRGTVQVSVRSPWASSVSLSITDAQDRATARLLPASRTRRTAETHLVGSRRRPAVGINSNLTCKKWRIYECF